MTVRFAVTGLERSGTSWLAQVLDDDPTVQVYHEPKPLAAWDERVLGMSHSGMLDAGAHVRARYNYWHYLEPEGDRAEVNSVIRHVARYIRTVWAIPVAAIIRDGRYVVRSLMKRGTFQKPNMPLVVAPDEIKGDPFASCSWYWADAYERLEANGILIWRLEDLNADWHSFQRLCEYLNVSVRKSHWKAWAGQRLNMSIPDTKPPVWTERQAALFGRWAGAMQRKYSYDGARVA